MKAKRVIPGVIMALATMLYAGVGLASSPGAWFQGEQYASEVVYAKLCGIEKEKIMRFEQGVPLLIVKTNGNQLAALEALDRYYMIKYSEEGQKNLSNQKITEEGCQRVKGRIEAILFGMDKHSILLNQRKISEND
jgi:hypothetical protein